MIENCILIVPIGVEVLVMVKVFCWNDGWMDDSDFTAAWMLLLNIPMLCSCG